MSIVVQVHERRLTVNLPNGPRTTCSQVVDELTRGELSEELHGKTAKLIFSGRVLNSTDLISSVVPCGGVVHCAILNTAPDVDLEEGSHSSEEDETEDRLPPMMQRTGALAPTRRARALGSASQGQFTDFVWGFALGYVVGPLMCFWLLETAPRLQKIGIVCGCCVQMIMDEYREVTELGLGKDSASDVAGEVIGSSFDVVDA